MKIPFKFFLLILLHPLRGLPCAEDFPLLFGEPNPIVVLQEIAVGFSENFVLYSMPYYFSKIMTIYFQIPTVTIESFS